MSTHNGQNVADVNRARGQQQPRGRALRPNSGRGFSHHLRVMPRAKPVRPNDQIRHGERVQDLRVATSFRWQGALPLEGDDRVRAGGRAREKSVPGVLNDLEYAVPFHVRDEVMAALNAEDDKKSDVNREYHWANKSRSLKRMG